MGETMISNEFIVFYILNNYFSNKSNINYETSDIKIDESVFKDFIISFNADLNFIIPSIYDKHKNKLSKLNNIQIYFFINRLLERTLIDSSEITKLVNKDIEELDLNSQSELSNYRNKLDGFWLDYLNNFNDLPYPLLRLKEFLEKEN